MVPATRTTIVNGVRNTTSCNDAGSRLVMTWIANTTPTTIAAIDRTSRQPGVPATGSPDPGRGGATGSGWPTTGC